MRSLPSFSLSSDTISLDQVAGLTGKVLRVSKSLVQVTGMKSYLVKWSISTYINGNSILYNRKVSALCQVLVLAVHKTKGHGLKFIKVRIWDTFHTKKHISGSGITAYILTQHCHAIIEQFKTWKVSTKLQVSQLLGFSLYSIVISVPDPYC